MAKKEPVELSTLLARLESHPVDTEEQYREAIDLAAGLDKRIGAIPAFSVRFNLMLRRFEMDLQQERESRAGVQ